MIAVKVYVEGLVQGVGYRSYTKRVAESYGLSGWVTNLNDGRVEVFIQGDEGIVWSFLKELWRGPKLSDVSSIYILKEVPNYENTGFRIIY